MTVRRILVTGSNRGIGLAVVNRCLLDHDNTFIIIACRSIARGMLAVDELCADKPGWKERLMVLEMDTSLDASVCAAAAKVEALFGGSPPPLFGIVNNAGIAAGAIGDILNVNVRGVKRVDDAFLPLLDPTAGRIVQMSSGFASGCISRSSAERQAFFVDPSVSWERISGVLDEVEACKDSIETLGISSGVGGGYGLSKALLNSYTMHMAREHQNLKINSCSPGMIATDIMGSFLPWWVPVPNFVIRFLARKLFGAKTPDEGTVSTMYLLFDKNLQGNGYYYGSDGLRSPLDTYRAPGSPPYEGL